MIILERIMTIDLKQLFNGLEDQDPKMAGALLNAIIENLQSDFDYIRFKQSVNNLQAMGIDEATSQKSAFTTASTMGLTKEKLKESAMYYQNIIKKEGRQFTEALQAQVGDKVDGKREEAKKLEATIEAHKQKIAQLEREIAAYQKKIDNVDAEIEKAKEKIEKTHQSFMAAYHFLIDQIGKDIEGIQLIL